MSESFIPVYFYSSMDFGRQTTETAFFIDPEIEQMESNFKLFCENVVISDTPDFSKPPQGYPIPPLIHFIWLGSPLPDNVKGIIDSWKTHHPGFTIKIWQDQDVSDFKWSKESSKKAFEETTAFSSKADILRFEILYQHGGIYSDTDVVCLKPFHDLIIHGATFFGGLELNQVWEEYGKPLYVGTAVIGAAKGSQVMSLCIDNFKPSLVKGHATDFVLKGGPGLLSQSCSKALSEELLILPCSYFYPLPFSRRKEDFKAFIAPESMAVHLWEQSWL